MKRPRLLPLAAVFLASLVSVAPGPAGALSGRHADDVRDGYRALTKTFYRTVAPAALLAGARRGIEQAYRKRGRTPPPFALPAPAGETLAAIIATIDAARPAAVRFRRPTSPSPRWTGWRARPVTVIRPS